MKILVTGAEGMLARAVTKYCSGIGDDVYSPTKKDLDITSAELVEETVRGGGFHAIINCAAFTDVDGSESQPDKCFEVNALGPRNLAVAAAANDVKLITISTDYVFDGLLSEPYDELSTPNPQGVYGKSKLEGELLVAAAAPSATIVRSGWIYGYHGKNFLSMVRSLLEEGKRIVAITDCFGTPTFADDLAVRLRELCSSPLSGVIHLSNTGSNVSYATFAEKICEIQGYSDGLLEYATSAVLNRPAPRPAQSALCSIRIEESGITPMPDWQNALERFLAE